MEQRKNSKKHIVQWACCIFALLLVGSMFYQHWYKPRYGYQPQQHTNEELLTLFAENHPLFDEVAQIIAQNDRFWKEGRVRKNDPNDTHIRIDSPDEKKKMKLFTEEEQAVLRAFFEIIGPYSIELDLDDPTKEEVEQETILERPKCIRLNIDCQMKTDTNNIKTFSFIYGYGTESETDEDMKLYSSGYNVPVIDLDNKWFCCYWG